MQAHEFHQHLVGIGGAIKRTGPRPVIAGHLGLHQSLAPHLARGEFLPHFGFFVIWQT